MDLVVVSVCWVVWFCTAGWSCEVVVVVLCVCAAGGFCVVVVVVDCCAAARVRANPKSVAKTAAHNFLDVIMVLLLIWNFTFVTNEQRRPITRADSMMRFCDPAI